MGKVGAVRGWGCQWALTERRTLWGGGTLERGHGALLEPLAQLGDTLGGVGALASPIDDTELVIGQTAVHGWCQRALTRMRTLWGGGALEGGDLRLLEDGSEREGALVSDVVVPDTARDGCGGTVRGQVHVSGP